MNAFRIINYEQIVFAPTAKIKQQIELLEIITGCETKNRYDVFAQIDSINYFIYNILIME